MEDTIGIIVAVAVIYVAYSWVFKSTSGNTPSTAGRTTGPPVFGQGVLRGVSESMVDSVCSAFPDIPRENVMYDLSKTRNPQLTVEKILTAGVLPAPPPGLFPPSTPIAAISSGSSSSTLLKQPVSTPTLLERYNLESRVPSFKGKERAVDEGPASVGNNAAKWETTAKEREASLKKRKEEMILEARRKLLEKKAKAQGRQDL